MLNFPLRRKYFSGCYPDIHVVSCIEHDLDTLLPTFLESIKDNVVGLAPVYGSKCCLTYLAVSSMTQAIVVAFPSKGKKHSKKKTDVSTLHGFLSGPTQKSAFQMDKLTTALFLDHGIYIVNGKDLLSSAKGTDSRGSLTALTNTLGNGIDKKAVIGLFRNEESHLNGSKVVALQAWAACCSASLPHMLPRLTKSPSINTTTLDGPILKMVAKTIRDASRLVSLKPTRQKHEIKCEVKAGQFLVTSQRYKTKVARTEGNQRLELRTRQSNGKTTIHTAKMAHLEGRLAKLTVGGKVHGPVQSLETVGRESPNSAEATRASIMLRVLQDRITLSTHPFINAIWLPSKKATWTALPKDRQPPLIYFPSERNLNGSQRIAVNAILSTKEADHVILIHGPPGTGKTTVIAATVTSVIASFDKTATLWLVAQSNVAVKNIAEKLASVDFFDFKIIVSKDYHFDWHEHQYKKIASNVISSDKFPEDVVAAERQLQGSRVILCTLSMLSNIKLATILRLVPPQTVVFDEASQIEVGDYFPMLVHFQSSLRKLVFIGDDKQLAPYGSTDITDLESIFEKAHLRKKAILLDTQYRMPIPIGNFISQNVYKGLLKSNHCISDPSCCRFVDVSNGVEESQGHSWTNPREVEVVIKIARQLASEGKSYRIITPYDSQRSRLENGLKVVKLPWEDRCFNVDSFQGNEDDYIVISLVRTQKLGFLKEVRRVNVMLTRCKKGMVICTNRNFIEGPGSKSLIGKLHRSLGNPSWLEGRNVLRNGVDIFT